MLWQVAVEEIDKNRNVQDDAPDDGYDGVFPHARSSVVLPVSEETRNHDGEDETQDDLKCCGAPTVERHGDEPGDDHRAANPLERYNEAPVGLRNGPRPVLRKSAPSPGPTFARRRDSLQSQLQPLGRAEIHQRAVRPSISRKAGSFEMSGISRAIASAAIIRSCNSGMESSEKTSQAEEGMEEIVKAADAVKL